MQRVYDKTKKRKNAWDRACIKPGRNNEAVKICQDTGHEAQNRDCQG